MSIHYPTLKKLFRYYFQRITSQSSFRFYLITALILNLINISTAVFQHYKISLPLPEVLTRPIDVFFDIFSEDTWRGTFLEKAATTSLHQIFAQKMIAPDNNLSQFLTANLALGYAPITPLPLGYGLNFAFNGAFVWLNLIFIAVHSLVSIRLLLAKTITPSSAKGLMKVEEVSTGEDELILTMSSPVRRPEVVYAKFLAFWAQGWLIDFAYVIWPLLLAGGYCFWSGAILKSLGYFLLSVFLNLGLFPLFKCCLAVTFIDKWGALFLYFFYIVLSLVASPIFAFNFPEVKELFSPFWRNFLGIGSPLLATALILVWGWYFANHYYRQFTEKDFS